MSIVNGARFPPQVSVRGSTAASPGMKNSTVRGST